MCTSNQCEILKWFISSDIIINIFFSVHNKTKLLHQQINRFLSLIYIWLLPVDKNNKTKHSSPTIIHLMNKCKFPLHLTLRWVFVCLTELNVLYYSSMNRVLSHLTFGQLISSAAAQRTAKSQGLSQRRTSTKFQDTIVRFYLLAKLHSSLHLLTNVQNLFIIHTQPTRTEANTPQLNHL